MVNESRIDIYDYIYNLLYGTVSENVYDMRVPQELTQSDITDGFLVLHVGNLVDESEFSYESYGRVRCYIEAFVPQISRGRVNHDIYSFFESEINKVIKEQSETDDGTYYIEQDSVISMDDVETSNADNSYFTFVKSFIVVIDKQIDVPTHFGDLYIGTGQEVLATIEDVESLDSLQYYDTNSPKGDYKVLFNDTSYLWLCTTAKINGVQSSYFAVPMADPIMVGDLRCYRSANSIIQGEMEFTIK